MYRRDLFTLCLSPLIFPLVKKEKVWPPKPVDLIFLATSSHDGRWISTISLKQNGFVYCYCYRCKRKTAQLKIIHTSREHIIYPEISFCSKCYIFNLGD